MIADKFVKRRWDPSLSKEGRMIELSIDEKYEAEVKKSEIDHHKGVIFNEFMIADKFVKRRWDQFIFIK